MGARPALATQQNRIDFWGGGESTTAKGQRNFRSEYPRHAGDPGCTGPAMPLPSPAQAFKSALIECFSAERQCPGGAGFRLQASQCHTGWWCCFPMSRECCGQSAMLQQQRPGNTDFSALHEWKVCAALPCLPRGAEGSLLALPWLRATARNTATLPTESESTARRMGLHSK